MPIEKYECSLHDEDGVVVEKAAVHIHGHPGITDWEGTIGPVEAELEIGPTYRLRLEDGREGLIVIQSQMKAWGGASGRRYSFEGVGGLT